MATILPFRNKKIKKHEINSIESISTFRQNLKTKIVNIMDDYDLMSAFDDTDIPEIYYKHEKKVCCLVFYGDHRDLTLLEEYLQNR